MRNKFLQSAGIEARRAVSRCLYLFAIHFFVLATLAQAQTQAQTKTPAPSFSNASPAEWAAIQNTLGRLEAAALARDGNALQFYGVATPPPPEIVLRLQNRTTHVAVSPTGALIRQIYGVLGNEKPISTGIHELWLSRLADQSFALTPRRFVAPPDAAQALDDAANVELKNVGDDRNAILDLVASRVGGRWIALRRQRWDGALFDVNALATASLAPREFIRRKMAGAPKTGAVTGHFLFQRGETGWIGLGTTFVPLRRLSAPADDGANQWRVEITGDDYLLPAAHRDFSLALAATGLWNEAADESQKAELLQPGIIGEAKIREIEAARDRDPQNLVARQLQNEQSVGLGADHPSFVISALTREQKNAPTALGALRLALEYSRLGDEERAAAAQKAAETLIPGGGGPRPMDAAWINLLYDHLNERRRVAAMKPTSLIRSALFTVRVWPDDVGALPLLAALEEAQHTVYADFGIPMGSTEVTLWHNQQEFARYTTQFSSQGGSEFVAALTLTKLVSTREGPLVLGEEINTFRDDRDGDALFSTVAHEYGHVAVRTLARGRLVPVWLNEGIATSVEGGYEGYISRVRRAANAGTLLSMRELQIWNVDGERAFIAYSEANSIVDYIVAKWGKGAVLEILRQIGRDVPPDQAFSNVLKLGPTELFQRWVQEGIR